MPLSMIGEGETATITRVGGKEETRRFLENLGFVVGAIVTVVNAIFMPNGHTMPPVGQ